MFGETNKNAEHFLIDGTGWGDWNSPTAPVHVCVSRTSHIHMKDMVGSSVCLFPMTPPLCAQLCPGCWILQTTTPRILQNPPLSCQLAVGASVTAVLVPAGHLGDEETESGELSQLHLDPEAPSPLAALAFRCWRRHALCTVPSPILQVPTKLPLFDVPNTVLFSSLEFYGNY